VVQALPLEPNRKAKGTRGPKRKDPSQTRSGRIEARVKPATEVILKKAAGGRGMGQLLDDIAQIVEGLGEIVPAAQGGAAGTTSG
jgi:hypothetical protein